MAKRDEGKGDDYFGKLFGQGAKPVADTSAEFWKPKKRGACLIGRVQSIGSNAVGEHVVLTPCLLIAEKGAKPDGFAEYSVGINTSLKRYSIKTLIGKTVAIVFLGMMATPAGSMKTYKVVELNATRFTELLQEHAPALLEPSARPASGDASESAEYIGEDDDDLDLPF